MKKLGLLLSAVIGISTVIIPVQSTKAVTQTSITRSQAEQRALQMINLKWTYNSSQNSNISSNYTGYVALPSQFTNVTTAQETGIPYDWGGEDGLDSSSYNAPWTNFLDAISKGAYAGNVNTGADHGYIQGTAGVDCSGFVQAVFDIQGPKLSTSTMFDTYFTKINLSDIKHMDILDRPGDHVVIFDKWGTLNGASGAYTYEANPDQTYGGIQGTKQYFITMSQINNGYIPGKYINIVDDPSSSTTVTQTTQTTSVTSSTTAAQTTTVTPSTTISTLTPSASTAALKPGAFAQVTNVDSFANFRSGNSTTSTSIGTIPKGTILYLIGSSSGWFQVKYNGQVGWIWGNTLSLVPSGTYVTVGSNIYMLNIRANPSSTSGVLGTLGVNQYAKVVGLSSDGKWMLINNNGIQGWAYKSYLSSIN